LEEHVAKQWCSLCLKLFEGPIDLCRMNGYSGMTKAIMVVTMFERKLMVMLVGCFMRLIGIMHFQKAEKGDTGIFLSSVLLEMCE
jgi:hypothetical protein